MLQQGDQAGRGPHHLRARRRGGLADPGLIRHFRPEIERRIAERGNAAPVREAAE